jgi:hypothetical protein
MRDGMLWIDGSLDLTMGGSMQSGFGTEPGEQQQPHTSVRRSQASGAKFISRCVAQTCRRCSISAIFGDCHHRCEQTAGHDRRSAGVVHDE